MYVVLLTNESDAMVFMQPQVHNRSPQQVACNNQQVLQQVAQLVVEQIHS